MKKKFPYFLLPIIVLVGLFSFAFNVQAEEPKGECRLDYYLSQRTPFEIIKNITDLECSNKAKEGICYVSPSKPDPSTGLYGDTVIAHKNPEECAAGNNPPSQTTEWKKVTYTWNENKKDSSSVPPASSGATTKEYHLLEPLPSIGGEKPLTDFNTRQTNALGIYLNLIIKIFIGLCAVLAVVMIVIGGIEYSTSELVSSKEAGKDRIRDALLGLLLALGAYLILFTINPDLLNTDREITPVERETTVHSIRVSPAPSNTAP